MSAARTVPTLREAIRANDEAAVRTALQNGENPRILVDGETALHAAVRESSTNVVEALIECGALEWMTDDAGRTPLDVVRDGKRKNRAQLIALLDRTVIEDASFRDAVDAIHRGDLERLTALVDDEPRLLHERIVGPEAYRKRQRADYFRDPKLFWHIANNPTRVEKMPANIAQIAAALIERGVERADREYALELVMTSGSALAQNQRRDLMRLLLASGASPTREAVVMTAAHGLLEPLHAIVEWGYAIDVPLAAAFGDAAKLEKLLSTANRNEANLALGLAVINRHVAAAEAALDAGADIDAFLPVHSHATALHLAAENDDVPIIALLLRRGARTGIEDSLWNGTPLGWATFAGNAAAKAVLEAHEKPR